MNVMVILLAGYYYVYKFAEGPLSIVAVQLGDTKNERSIVLLLGLSIIFLATIVLFFIKASKFPQIKLLTRSEDNTPEFSKVLVSIFLGYFVGGLGIFSSLIDGDHLYMNIFVPYSIIYIFINRILFKDKPAERISDKPIVDVKVKQESPVKDEPAKNISDKPIEDIQKTQDSPVKDESEEKVVFHFIPEEETHDDKEDLNLEYASFFRRVFAAVVDFLIASVLILGALLSVSVVSVIIVDPTMQMSEEGMHELWSKNPALIVIGCIFITTWLYYALFESSKTGATPGKMLLGIKVTGYDGDNISFWQASKRIFLKHFMFMISFLIIPIFAFLIAAFNAKKQASHDVFAKTLVVKNKP